MKLTPFGLYIRQLRLVLGMSMKELADEISVSSAYLSAVELGARALTSKIGDDVVRVLTPRLTAAQRLELEAAISKSLHVVQVAELSGEDRRLVAAFARRLSDGNGAPPDVLDWIGGGRDGSNYTKR